jgi:hypothetical protein
MGDMPETMEEILRDQLRERGVYAPAYSLPWRYRPRNRPWPRNSRASPSLTPDGKEPSP